LGWCPSGDCPEDATPAFTDVTHLIVHHSAGSNSASDWAAVVRSIYDFHVFSNGWDDIGYNWLVDPNGVIYQGRGDNVRGAHFCGTNSNTMGVCMMGDFTSVLPATAAVSSLEDLLAWKVCDIGVTADGTALHNGSGQNLMHISGHRDGCSTACPGDLFYPTLSDVRDSVKWLIDTECNDLTINAPTNMAAELGTGSQIEVTWDDNADNETGYQLERSANDNTNFSVIADLPANTTLYQDNVDPGLFYYYRAKATVGSAYSNYSNEGLYTPPSNAAFLLDENTIQVAPNPTAGQVAVSIENDFVGEMSLTVFNVMGQAVRPSLFFEKNKQHISMDVDMTGLAAGVYVFKITQNGRAGTVRVVRF
jgi:hypothetical protein